MTATQGELGRRIRVARTLADLRVAELATACDVLPITTYRWEIGRTTPSLAQLDRIATVTRVSHAWLAFGKGEPRTATTRKKAANDREE